MGYDLNNQFVPEARTIATNVTLHQGGQISATTVAALKALPAELRAEGLSAVVTGDRSRWVFSASSTAADTTNNLVLTPDAGAGRWLRADRAVQLKLAIAFGTADAAVLFTVPAAMRLYIDRTFWEVTADFTGGTSSTIGLSSSQADFSTKGDLLGGGSGDAAANLTAGVKKGTIGTDFGSNGVIVLEAASTIRFDRITSAFTAGAGFAHVLARQVA